MTESKSSLSREVDGTLIRERRRSMGYSQVRLAQLANLSENTVIKAEKGGPISFTTIAHLCDQLNISFSMVVTKEGVTYPTYRVTPDNYVAVDVVFPCDEDSDPKDVEEFAELLRQRLSAEQIAILKARLGSLHVRLNLPSEAVNRLRIIATPNVDGEYELSYSDVLPIDQKISLAEWESICETAMRDLAGGDLSRAEIEDVIRDALSETVEYFEEYRKKPKKGRMHSFFYGVLRETVRVMVHDGQAETRASEVSERVNTSPGIRPARHPR